MIRACFSKIFIFSWHGEMEERNENSRHSLMKKTQLILWVNISNNKRIITADIWEKTIVFQNGFRPSLEALLRATINTIILDCLKPPWNLVFSIRSKKLGKESVSNGHNLPSILNARWKRDIYRDVHVRHARRQNRGVLERFLAWRSLRTVKRVQRTRVQTRVLARSRVIE